jgi:Trk K+ transport system NAD-binding subunit
MGQYDVVFRFRRRSDESSKTADARQTMRIGIAGAGAIGRSVATELLAYGHKILLIEVGKRVRDIVLPENTALAIVIRDGGVMLPQPDDVLRTDDEMLFFAGGAVEDQIRALVHGATKPLRGR